MPDVSPRVTSSHVFITPKYGGEERVKLRPILFCIDSLFLANIEHYDRSINDLKYVDTDKDKWHQHRILNVFPFPHQNNLTCAR